MELYLIVPVLEDNKDSSSNQESLNGRLWEVRKRTKIDTEDSEKASYNCVSYVWGSGREPEGGLFGSEIEISNKTRPALEAAMRAAELNQSLNNQGTTEGFWIDAICVPQQDSAPRWLTLESMGYIYSRASTVIIVLQEETWEVIYTVCSMTGSPGELTYKQLKQLEQDPWISSVWTYQELVNGGVVIFTSIAQPCGIVSGDVLFNCLGHSLSQWKKKSKVNTYDELREFKHLNIMEDALVEIQMGFYLGRFALAALSNITLRRYDPQYPKNRLLACLGVLTQDPSWGEVTGTMSDLVARFLKICEDMEDYSYIYTIDDRDKVLRWRPSTTHDTQTILGPANLIPILSWHCYAVPLGDSQRLHIDAQGRHWLENMTQLNPAESMSAPAIKHLHDWLYGIPSNESKGVRSEPGFFPDRDTDKASLEEMLHQAFQQLGYSGCGTPHTYECGLFYSQKPLAGRQDLQVYGASSIRWAFGNPGLAIWKDGDVTNYSPGVFAGILPLARGQDLLLS